MRHRGKRVVHLSTVLSLAGIALLLAVVVAVPVAASDESDTLLPPEIYKTAPCVDGTCQLTISVINPGGDNESTWTDVIVTDVIDPAFEIVHWSVQPPADDVTINNNLVTVTVDSLAPGEQFVIRIDVEPLAPLGPGEEYFNTAFLAYKNAAGEPQDPVESNQVKIPACHEEPEEPPFVPEASTLILFGSAATGLAGYVGLQVRARRYKRR